MAHHSNTLSMLPSNIYRTQVIRRYFTGDVTTMLLKLHNNQLRGGIENQLSKINFPMSHISHHSPDCLLEVIFMSYANLPTIYRTLATLLYSPFGMLLTVDYLFWA
ncbi:hypothetical protein BDQ17DRAFT_1407177 [Cyathus striatus]|nr:hypothetical protein BDQ17DRAFT_1407177 [Cyathus striatus]